MYYENSLTITLKNEKTAAAALEIMKTRLVAGFDYDKGYKRVPSMLMHDTLEVEDNTVILTEEFGCYFPNHAEAVIPELMQYLATHLSTEAFTFESVNSGDYDESWIKEATEKRGLLNYRTTADCMPHLLDKKNVEMLTANKDLYLIPLAICGFTALVAGSTALIKFAVNKKRNKQNDLNND
mgnify:CR=1 FL=1